MGEDDLSEMNVTVRQALVTDAKHFSDLALLSSPLLFPTIYGVEIDAVMQHLFRQRRNLFSFEHTYFAEVDHERAGMILGYDWRARSREEWRTGLFMLTKMRMEFLSKLSLLLKFNGILGVVGDLEYYISNFAVYPEYRGIGIGTRLILEVEEMAKKNGAERIALEVEAENSGAVRLYRRLGYLIDDEISVLLQGDKPFHFYRMRKELR